MTLMASDEDRVFDSVPLDNDPTVDLFALLRQRRGWTDEYLAQIEDPSHEPLKDLEPMIECLDQIRAKGLQITIAPDFDMDGIASGVLGYAGLSELGFDVNLQIPDYRRGHELTRADIEEIDRLFPDTDVLLTCDSGVNSYAGLHAARTRGWITLVTDHHQELEPGCPADITVDPCRLDETYAHPGICGAAVLHQVLEAYAARFAPEKKWQIRMLSLFAGLGTVSDVMPLLYENRQLVRNAVSIARLLRAPAPRTKRDAWNQLVPDYDLMDPRQATMIQLMPASDLHPVYRRAFLGFATLLKAFAQADKLRADTELTEEFFGFYLAPAMNSPRRIETDIAPCFKVFTSETIDEMHAAAQTVIEYSAIRKQRTGEYLEQMLDDEKAHAQPLAPWVWFSPAPTGMQGLLANQIMHRTGLPAVVMSAPGSASAPIGGSARAPQWFPVIDVLAPVMGMHAVGHQQACGVKLQRADLLPELVDALRENAALASAAAQQTQTRAADLRIGVSHDCDTDLEDVEAMQTFIRRIASMKPFGHRFEAPSVELVVSTNHLALRRIGSESQHLQMITAGGMKLLWWNAAEQHYEALRQVIDAGHRFRTLRFTAALQLNEFRGVERVQAVIQDRLEDDYL